MSQLGYDDDYRPIKQGVPDTYYCSVKWFRPKVGYIVREQWFTQDSRGSNLIAFRERLSNDKVD